MHLNLAKLAPRSEISTVDPGYNQRQGNAIGVPYNRTFLYPGFKRNEIASQGQDTH